MTVGKLVPLALFIVIGLAYVEPSRLTTLPPITLQQSLTAGLLLIFIYGGYEVVPVPAGESLDPRRDVPFAMVATIAVVMIVMTLTQIVAQGVLANVADHATPIADAAAAFLGATGALLIGIGSVISMTGNNAGQVLSGSRMLFALAEQGQLPSFLARVHSRYRTPANAIIFTSAVALTLALSGSFAQIALVSALARLLMYGGSAAATLRLRAPRFAGVVKPAGFTAPFGPVMPVVAIGVCVGLAAGATRDQMLGGIAALAVGAALYLMQRRLGTAGWLTGLRDARLRGPVSETPSQRRSGGIRMRREINHDHPQTPVLRPHARGRGARGGTDAGPTDPALSLCRPARRRRRQQHELRRRGHPGVRHRSRAQVRQARARCPRRCRCRRPPTAVRCLRRKRSRGSPRTPAPPGFTCPPACASRPSTC